MAIKTRNEALSALEFPENSNPSESEIKKNYHRKALRVHPDHNHEPTANAQFAEIAEAFSFLSLPRARQEALSHAAASNSSQPSFTNTNRTREPDPRDLFNNFFNPSFNFENIFNAFFPNTANTEAPYCLHASIFNIKKNVTTRFGRDYYFEDEADLARQCQASFTTALEVTIESFKLRLPPNGPEIILGALLANKKMRNFKGPNNFFNAAQQERLDAHLIQNRNRGKQSDIRWIQAGVALGGILSMLSGQAFLFILCESALCGLFALILKKAFNEASETFYNDVASIQQSPLAEQRALKKGIESGTWPGYFNSFKDLSTYGHPVAFRTGVRLVEKENEALINTVRALNIP